MFRITIDEFGLVIHDTQTGVDRFADYLEIDTDQIVLGYTNDHPLIVKAGE